MTKYTVGRTATTVMYQTIDADTPEEAIEIAEDLGDWDSHEMIADEYEVWEEN